MHLSFSQHGNLNGSNYWKLFMSLKSLQNFLLAMQRNQKCCWAGSQGEQGSSSAVSGEPRGNHPGKIKGKKLHRNRGELHFRQFTEKPRKFQKFHLKISWLIYTEALFLQSTSRLTWSNIKAAHALIHCSYLLPRPLGTPPGHEHGNKLEMQTKSAEWRPKQTHLRYGINTLFQKALFLRITPSEEINRVFQQFLN